MSCTGACVLTAIQKITKCEIPPKKNSRWETFKINVSVVKVMSSKILFGPQPKDVNFSVIEDKRS